MRVLMSFSGSHISAFANGTTSRLMRKSLFVLW